MLNPSELRNLELIPILQAFGLERDHDDRKQYKGAGHRISIATNNFKWYDHSAQKGGGGAIDLVMHLNGCNFNAACDWLNGGAGWIKSTAKAQPVVDSFKQSFIPARNDGNLPAVREYLIRQRKLEPVLVDWCISNGLLFADDFKNCVFLYGNGAELRGIGSVKWNRCYGSLDQAFFIPGNTHRKVVFCESAIDALSYRQLNLGVPVFSTAGCQRYSLIKQVLAYAVKHGLMPVCGFDNDAEANKSYQTLCDENRQLTIHRELPKNKDWNLDLGDNRLNGI